MYIASTVNLRRKLTIKAIFSVTDRSSRRSGSPRKKGYLVAGENLEVPWGTDDVAEFCIVRLKKQRQWAVGFFPFLLPSMDDDTIVPITKSLLNRTIPPIGTQLPRLTRVLTKLKYNEYSALTSVILNNYTPALAYPWTTSGHENE